MRILARGSELPISQYHMMAIYRRLVCIVQWNRKFKLHHYQIFSDEIQG